MSDRPKILLDDPETKRIWESAKRGYVPPERSAILRYLREDRGLNLERHYERLRVADEIERGAHLVERGEDDV